ncbi:MAG: hypothetical protein AABY28_02530 [Candidatus Omnitrophota bacterium]
MRVKKEKKNSVNWREYRIRLLEAEKQNYEMNPNFPSNVKMANAILVQNDIRALKITSGTFSKKLRRSIRNSRKILRIPC